MPKVIDDYPMIVARDRASWRSWLRRHHRTSPGVWLVYRKKHSAAPSVRYEEAVQEALCFGWIDSLVRTVDHERYRQVFTPRKPGSGWSAANKRRVARLVAEGLMQPAGLAKVRAAKADGSWGSLDTAESLRVPPELRRALAAEGDALRNFRGYPASLRKAMIYWIAGAKRSETRSRRLARLVSYAASHTSAREFRP